MLERESKRRGYALSTVLSPASFESISRRYGLSDVDEMYAAIGYGSLNTGQVIFKLLEYQRQHSEHSLAGGGPAVVKPKTSKRSNQVIIKGYDDLLVRFSKCCSPVPGDNIIGYISHGRGITIHRDDCPTIKQLERERMIDAEWSGDLNTKFSVSLQVTAEDKGEFTIDITKIITNLNIPILAMNAKKNKNHNLEAVVTVEITDNEQLARLIEKLRSHPRTLDVFRTRV
jgi:GTP pyrophosphokinase